MKKTMLLAGALFGFMAIVGLMNTSNTVFAASRDCSANAIVQCGVLSTNEMKTKYTENKPGDLDNIFAYYGITSADINTMNVKEGRAYKDGRIVVDGKTVATDAASLGRSKKAGDYAVNIDGKTYWEGTNQTAFNSDSLEVYVFMNADGTFKAAVIKDCGNPMKGKPTPKPEQPKPEQPKPKPTYTCESLTVSAINRTTYRFKADAKAANGANIVEYVYNFGDGTTKKSTKTTVEHEYTKAGEYKATVTAVVGVGGKTETTTNAACAAQVTVEEEPAKEQPVEEAPAEEVTPCPIKGKENLPADSDECEEEEVPAVIPATGVGSVLSGLVGLSSLSGAGYYYVRSRRLL